MSKHRSRHRQSAPVRPAGAQKRRREAARADVPAENTRPVRLTRKYAEMIDGVDLSHANVGDELYLTPRDADVLIAEGWAVPVLPRPSGGTEGMRWQAHERPRSRRRSKRR